MPLALAYTFTAAQVTILTVVAGSYGEALSMGSSYVLSPVSTGLFLWAAFRFERTPKLTLRRFYNLAITLAAVFTIGHTLSQLPLDSSFRFRFGNLSDALTSSVALLVLGYALWESMVAYRARRLVFLAVPGVATFVAYQWWSYIAGVSPSMNRPLVSSRTWSCRAGR